VSERTLVAYVEEGGGGGSSSCAVAECVAIRAADNALS
jgi:hypothetical protein